MQVLDFAILLIFINLQEYVITKAKGLLSFIQLNHTENHTEKSKQDFKTCKE